jgi:hypothetical protein
MTFHPNHLLLPCHDLLLKVYLGNTKGWLDNASSNRFFNFPLIICQSSTKPLSIISLTLECEDVLGNQFTGPFSLFS